MSAPAKAPLVGANGLITSDWLNYFAGLETGGGVSSFTNVTINRSSSGGGSSITVATDASELTGDTLASNVVNSSLTGVGTLTSGGLGAGFVLGLATVTLTGALPWANMPSGAGVWSAAPTITGDLTISANLMPSLADASDIGSATRLFRRGYLSELNAVLFAKETISLYGGWLMVTKNAGTFATDIASADTSIDFGQAMTLNQFVVVRAADTGGTITAEYMQVGSNVSGTVYNVTRNLSGAGAKNWAKSTPYAVLGVSGDGWVELNAFDTPRLSVWTQGSAYNNSTEVIRVGHLTGMPNSSSGIGAYMGDATNYFRWDGSALKLVSAGCTIDASGITLGTPSSFTSTSALKFERAGGTGFGQSGDVNSLYSTGGAGATFIGIDNTIKGTAVGVGGVAGRAIVGLSATGWDNSGAGSATTSASIDVRSEIGLSRVLLTAGTISASSGLYERSRSARMGEWTSYTPTVTNFTLGDGTLTGKYTQVGNITVVRVDIIFGSTSAFTAAITVSFPVTMITGSSFMVGSGEAIDVSTSQSWFVRNRLASSTTFAPLVSEGAAAAVIQATAPFTWATGDELHLLIVGENA